jgi:hypothetical protein
LIKEICIAISHTFSRDTTNPYLPFVPIPISTHPIVEYIPTAHSYSIPSATAPAVYAAVEA